MTVWATSLAYVSQLEGACPGWSCAENALEYSLKNAGGNSPDPADTLERMGVGVNYIE